MKYSQLTDQQKRKAINAGFNGFIATPDTEEWARDCIEFYRNQGNVMLGILMRQNYNAIQTATKGA